MKDPMFKVKEEKATNEYGEFIIEPLETGFGHTLGNAFRRVLLTAIPGAAVTSVKITGVKHKFSTIPGFKENVVDLLLNIKGLNVRLLDSRTSATVRLSVKGETTITASDLELSDAVEIVDPAYYIGSLTDKKGKIEMEFTIEKGYGYSLAEERKITTLGVMPTDAIFTPVRRVNYSVAATRVGRQTNLDRLVLEVWTNGTITPKDALGEAAKLLSTYFLQVHEPKVGIPSDGVAISPTISEDILKLTIDELDLPTRIYNSLRNGGIETLGQLLGAPKKDLMSMRNMGGKSITAIEEKLREKGISLSI
ncbi:MAG: DNA-directed RNA polymerase subunit alpha [Candidatus Levybacteria bacterium RIFCSPHIGHO2_12_FULL_38_12]|nr:MAG: DNA-directed RNA polymerase subunit alpha [Candidatus Levybacteria bacterium RIFCSPHIGHO2_01_FULL_38_12]OGH21947.1 MAG: DNA-directed RNA polymerase subunit alpha [Candidatus Levybacteria bacterium RIFCSPHIGHO2_02_FULL_37_18]OGH23019.1 MAG: DNA-directed RNA polymerase subunit alpha [Candidatus Levybacteria bacterium RIFCSPHIGHO2_12_FULL_38_12]OGH33641.1 MAG: DNA-directed RNA polymerase subunit alpha [Candidatus Levybacteria bacterium RIFCSPLOWO2_01_FULL_37_20]OGH44546.1 MAG: DNA-directed